MLEMLDNLLSIRLKHACTYVQLVEIGLSVL